MAADIQNEKEPHVEVNQVNRILMASEQNDDLNKTLCT
jgi:hypothetical protein